ncbi:uncharacterized protein BCR38DRAFT_462126 [Pseudomassariella vexata]|uniref:Uncharacterized protein n=1 Tax=Pseudomassariella vexata TaxID=1141098 RepID=A0A1Y2D6P5_9PEZI|nr:uncharacterized protein BCR38DRAFT_462126 [Pseudomassariella vexata]ORY54958.1 hypothetical protein BCR38DRAFT_462126 [Pseudomassariella vexata]
MNVGNIPNMNAMGGPVGGGGPMPMPMNNGAMAQVQQTQQAQRPEPNHRTILNTYIYDYFLRENMFDCARAMLNSNQEINVAKDSPGRRRDENGSVGNGLGDAPMDTDSKDDMDSKRPNDLPAPNLPASSDSCFLYEWFCLFWDMLGGQRTKQASNPQVNQYINYTQQQSRLKSTAQQDMLRQMRPDGPNGMQFNPMVQRMPNGMAMNAKQNNLARTAMANNQNPQAMQMLQQKQNQMQRDPSDMEGNNRRPASPGSNDNAPSPSKRPRLDGNTPFNPQQGGMMNNARPQQAMPGQQQVGIGPNGAASQTQQLLMSHGINPQTLTPQQFQNFANQPAQNQQKSIQAYAQNLQQQQAQQMPNKVMPNPGAPQGQGSPMMAQGPNSAELTNFYNPGDMPGNGAMRPGPGGNGQGGGSNHALQDYQMQLMLLEQQNKKRLMMARQEQDSLGGLPRGDGPAGPGGPGGPGGPNGQPFADASPQAQRPGASPNPSEQMKRGTPQMNPAGIPSPIPEGAQSRGSPNPMSFMPQQMEPNMAPHFFKPGMDGSVNNNMAAPFNGQMNPQMMRAGQQGGQGGPQMQWQNGPNGANPMAPQGGPQGQVQGTPQQRAMPPPSAPASGNGPNGRTQPSSPAQSNAAPPTPQQSNKAAPKKKDTKATKSKAAASKKNTTTGATPVSEASQEPETQQPATPITPVNPGGFAKNGQNGGGAQPMPNAQTSAAPSAPVPVAPQHADPAQGGFGMDMNGGMVDFGPLEFANNGPDVLQDFDFDSFLHDGETGGDFDFNNGFGLEGAGEIGAE